MATLFKEETLTALYEEIDRRARLYRPLILAIDGNSGTGKSTLGELLSKKYDANLFHTDDFFTPARQREKTGGSDLAGNFDQARFLREVLLPLLDSRPFAYRKFDCKRQLCGLGVKVSPRQINIIEGAYSTFQAVKTHCGLTVFLKADLSTRLERIARRNGEQALPQFCQKWIPDEDAFFEASNTEKICDIVIET